LVLEVELKKIDLKDLEKEMEQLGFFKKEKYHFANKKPKHSLETFHLDTIKAYALANVGVRPGFTLARDHSIYLCEGRR
jgi:hypothetical protein